MSIKAKDVDVNDMQVPNESLKIKINKENLSLRDHFQTGDQVSRHHLDPMRGQTKELIDGHFQDENSKTHLIMVFKIEEHKQDNITYHQQTIKHSEINQGSDPTEVGIQNVHSSIPRENYVQKFEKINIQRVFRQEP